jgi:hypothetical protein
MVPKDLAHEAGALLASGLKAIKLRLGLVMVDYNQALTVAEAVGSAAEGKGATILSPRRSR